MAPITVTVEGRDRELADDSVHALVLDSGRLDIGRDIDGGPARRLGYFVPVLGRWYFRADSVPAARVLRFDGVPVTNSRHELRADRVAVELRDVGTGPVFPPADPPARARRSPVPPSPGPRSPVSGGTGPGGSGTGTSGTSTSGGGGGGAAGPGPGDEPPAPPGSRRYVIGRAGAGADIAIADPLLRARHATVRIDGNGRWWVSGEIYVGGVRRMAATLSEGDVFVVGQTAVTVSGDLLRGREPAAFPSGVRELPAPSRPRPSAQTGLAVRLSGVTVFGRDGRTRLNEVSLAIGAGQVVAVVGPSGAGKSSLIKVLTGDLAEDEGTVEVGPPGAGHSTIALRRRQVRYVPQADEDLYQALTVRETLTYAARLRAAPDTGRREIAERVGDVLRRLGLEQPQRRVDELSGGQRRRVSIGLELVGDPKLLLLDEPTSGLDPGKDRAIMADLRAVSDSYHCTVVIVTHAVQHLEYVDKVVVVARGGRVRDAGPPAQVLAALGYDSWADLMIDLDREPAPDAAARPGARGRPAALLSRVPAPRPSLRGYRTLLSRQLTLTRRRGPASLAVLLSVPAVCTLVAVVASEQGLRPGGAMGAVLSILITVAALTGASLSYLDFVIESEVLRRDWRLGIGVLAIMSAKATVHSGVCALLAALISGVFAALRPLPDPAHGIAPPLMLYGTCLSTMLASMGFGLLISAWSPTQERAVTWSTLLAVLQVALSGALFKLQYGLQLLTVVLPARVGLAAVASYADLNRHRGAALYEDWLWRPGAPRYWGLNAVLLGIFVLTGSAARWRLHRRWTR